MTGMVNVLQEAKKRKGVKVIIAKQLCVITARRTGVKRGRYTVEPRGLHRMRDLHPVRLPRD